MEPLVSILIPHHERAALLAETLASVRAQTYGRWEALVVDDGSSEATWAALQAHAADPRIRLMRRTGPPAGPSRCRNVGLAAATGAYVLFLDSDDLLAPWCLRERVAALERAPDLDFMVFAGMLFHAVPGDRNLLWNELDGEDDLGRFLGATPPWQTSSVLWRSGAIRGVGGFDEALRYGTDSDLHTRALAMGLRYRKASPAAPDFFIRRDDGPRITNQGAPAMVEARLARLAAGNAFLAARPDAARLLARWEIQYFWELEFLIFNLPDNRAPIFRLLRRWTAHHRPPAFLRALLYSYALVGVYAHRHAYLLLRLMRRLTLRLLPGRLRPPATPDGFQATPLPAATYEQLLGRLRRAAAPSLQTPG